jgi:hypothetical protein
MPWAWAKDAANSKKASAEAQIKARYFGISAVAVETTAFIGDVLSLLWIKMNSGC